MIGTVQKKEVHKRIPVEEVDPLQYDDLIYKVILKYARQYGSLFLARKEDFYIAGMIGVLKAKKVYDPSRGTFVTIAYYKIVTEILQLWKSMMKEEQKIDHSNSYEDVNEDIVIDRIENSPDIYADYEGIGKLLTGRNKKLYWCLLNGISKSKTCAMCDIPWAAYKECVAELREEVLAIHKELGNY